MLNSIIYLKDNMKSRLYNSGKNLFVIFCIVITVNAVIAQVNLVPNPSFEIFSNCPVFINTGSPDQMTEAIGWYSSMGTADYFNSCAPVSSNASVPFNAFGYRTASSGNAYAGIIARWAGTNSFRESIGTELLTNLQIGQKYYASFKVSLSGGHYGANYNWCGINKLAILFSTFHYDSLSQCPICSNCAQICSDSIVTDTLNWTRIIGSFVADSNYSYINIGRFNLNSMTDSIELSGTQCNAYYYIDDVCISSDSLYTNNFIYTGIEIEKEYESFICFPNPTNGFITIQDSKSEIIELRLFNLQGEIMQCCYIPSLNAYTFNLSSLADGAYYISILRKNKQQINKLIIKQ